MVIKMKFLYGLSDFCINYSENFFSSEFRVQSSELIVQKNLRTLQFRGFDFLNF